jgi:hypothetical protein
VSQEALKGGGQVTAFLTPPEVNDGSPQVFQVCESDFVDPPGKANHQAVDQDFLLIGFDTEYKTPDDPVTKAQIVKGQARYSVLSYQFHAKTSAGQEWQGICCPQRADARMSFAEFMVFVLGSGVKAFPGIKFPRKIYFAGHFLRADATGFSDFQSLRAFLNNVRNTFLSIDSPTKVEIDCGSANPVTLNVMFRDSILLAPQNARSLKELGELVGQPKLTLDPDPARHKDMIRNMDKVRADNWPLFKQYAMTDATVCLMYIERIMTKFEELTGVRKVPVTLTSIGIELLLKGWQDRKVPLDPMRVLGKELVKESHWDDRLSRKITKQVAVPLETVFWHLDFVTSTYHGGRNEQFWFGPCFEDDWTDYDLSSAYPTAMAMIGLPDWDAIEEVSDISRFTPEVLGFAYVEFSFQGSVRFPCLAVRTANGLIYPRSGRSYCAAPELHLAVRLGATLKMIRGVIVPCDRSVRVFGDFITDCIAARAAAGSKTLEGLFWKEISNSTYGKTAQGLRRKRVYDMRADEVRQLPESKITNPFYASYITSFTRAVLAEILNALPPTVCVFSCTTDGFLCNASATQIEIAQRGELALLFRQAREQLTGKPSSALEAKHRIRQPLGWRTRGQATLKPGDAHANDGVERFVLAKGGIYTEDYLDSIEERNMEIVMLFLCRTPEKTVTVKSKVGIRDMVQYDADFIDKEIVRRLSMEYDWKCRPTGIGWSNEFKHIFFGTEPWDTVHQFDRIREIWEDYTPRVCLKTVPDYCRFADHVEVETHIGQAESRYMSKVGGDVRRLRKQFCTAWRNSLAGLTWNVKTMNARQLATILDRHGIPCTAVDVANDVRVPFKPGTCPATERVRGIRAALKKQEFPDLQVEAFLYKDASTLGIMFPTTKRGPFMDRVK